MTPDQQKDAERHDRYIAREGLFPVMNDTKWREAMDAVQTVMGSMAGDLRFRVKCIREAEASGDHWETSFPYHVPRPYKVIEWLEIEAFVGRDWVTREGQDYADALAEAFADKGIPCNRAGTVLRLQGYLRTH